MFYLFVSNANKTPKEQESLRQSKIFMYLRGMTKTFKSDLV